MRLQIGYRRIEGKDFAVNPGFTDSTSDQLGVLRTEVEYDYPFMTVSLQKRKTPEVS